MFHLILRNNFSFFQNYKENEILTQITLKIFNDCNYKSIYTLSLLNAGKLQITIIYSHKTKSIRENEMTDKTRF